MDILTVSAYVTEPGNRDSYTQKLLLYYMTGFVKTAISAHKLNLYCPAYG